MSELKTAHSPTKLVTKQLKVDLYNQKGEKIQSFKALNLDATQNITIMSIQTTVAGDFEVLRWPIKIENWTIVLGIVQIHYVNGYYAEITRVYD